MAAAGVATTTAQPCQRVPARERVFFEFPYVCPEPVLANVFRKTYKDSQFLYESGEKNIVLPSSSTGTAK
jgi:hypothetical protein